MTNKDIQRKCIKIADLGKFEVLAFAPIYRQCSIDEADGYFINDISGEKIGQHITLAILPDGTFEAPHHSVFLAQENKVIKLTAEDIPYSKAYLRWLETNESTAEQ